MADGNTTGEPLEGLTESELTALVSELETRLASEPGEDHYISAGWHLPPGSWLNAQKRIANIESRLAAARERLRRCRDG